MRTRKLLETMLCRRNPIKGINTWAILLIRYPETFLKWIREELRQKDRRAKDIDIYALSLTPKTNMIGALGTIPINSIRRLEELEIEGQAETIQTTSLFSQNTGKNPGDLRRLAVTLTPLKKHNASGKNSQGVIIIILLLNWIFFSISAWSYKIKECHVVLIENVKQYYEFYKKKKERKAENEARSRGVDWLNDFIGMSTRRWLFYAWRLWNCVHCTSIFLFLCCSFIWVFAHSFMISSIPI